MNAITAMTLARMESADMAGSLKRWRLAPLTNQKKKVNLLRAGNIRQRYAPDRKRSLNCFRTITECDAVFEMRY
jgi:hypothetical protein